MKWSHQARNVMGPGQVRPFQNGLSNPAMRFTCETSSKPTDLDQLIKMISQQTSLIYNNLKSQNNYEILKSRMAWAMFRNPCRGHAHESFRICSENYA